VGGAPAKDIMNTTPDSAQESASNAPADAEEQNATTPQDSPAKATKAPRKRAPRKTAAKDTDTGGTDTGGTDASPGEPAAAESTEPVAKAPRKRAPRKTAGTADSGSGEAAGKADSGPTEAAGKTDSSPAEAAGDSAQATEEAAAQPTARATRAPRKRAAAKTTKADDAGDGPAESEPEAAADPKAAAEPEAATEEKAPSAKRAAARKPRTSKKQAQSEQPTDATAAPEAGTAEPTEAEQVDAEAADDTPATERPAKGSRQRRASRSAEQQIDVLAAFSAAEPTEPAVADAADEDAEDSDEDTEGTEEGVRLPATALLFQAPDPAKGRRRVRAQAGPPPARTEEPGEPDGERDGEEQDDDRSAGRRRAATGRDDAASAAEDAGTDQSNQTDDSADSDQSSDSGNDEGADSSTGGGQRRRRRRGGRGRRNRGGGRDNGDSPSDDAGEDDDQSTEDQPAGDQNGTAPDQSDNTDEDRSDEGEGSSRRRRRRRRSGNGGGSQDDGTASSREGRAARNEITALKGSTRLEAKRQRRREGRDAGRRRATITEAEFLARREAVEREMVVRELDGRIQIAVLEDGVLVEHYVAQEKQSSMVGNVYLGRVQNVLPSMEAAFVDLGKGRNAVLYAGEVNWDAVGMEGQPRRIEQALSSGDSVLVQVTKDPIGHKGARLTAQVTLAGRYLVLVPSGAMTGISRKLPENERARLKKLLKEIVPEGAGVIVRTAAEGASEEQLRADVERLTGQWAEIQAKSKSAKSAPVLLKGEPELAVRVVRDVFNEDFRSLTVSGDGAWQTISSYVRELSPDLADRMHHWTDTKDVFSAHRIDEQLAKGMDRKVYLPSGGSLVIDRTEAMTVVDVNTGKFTGSGGTLEETVTKNNLEAAEEIVRQLRLRDIGGIIVIDFIDMVLESNRDLVLRRLVECLGRDRTRHQVAEVTSLGLVQMTRKRVGQGLVEAFSEPCEHCGGRGFIVHDHPVDKSSGGGGGNGNEGGGRRRRRGGARQEEPAAPAEDPQAVAAREAVKATLATIAAAAAQAHEEEPTAKDENASGSVPAASTAAKSLPEGESGKDQDATTADNTSRQGDTQSAQGGRRGRGKGGQPARAEAPAGEPRRRPSSLEELTAALPDGAGRGGARADRSAAQPVQAPDEAPTASADRATSAPADQPVAEQQVAADESTSSPQDQPAAHEPTPAPRAEDQPAADEPTPAPRAEDQPAGDQPTSDQPTPDQPTPDQPTSDQPAEGQSAVQSRKRRPRRVTSGGPVTA